jgi:hypothetical protein
LARFEFESGIVLFCFVFHLPLFRLENRVCLSRGVQVAGAAWRVATRPIAGVGDLVQRTMYGHTGRVLGGWAVEWSGGAVCGPTTGTWRLEARVSWLSHKTKVDGL